MKETTFLDKCKGIMFIFIGIASILYSISPAQADNAPQTTYGTGKYQMQLTSLVSPNNKVAYYILVWDTETGRSKFYYGNIANGISAAGSQYNLPSSPL